VRMCYADPPYPGEVPAHYPGESEVDHAALIAQLVREYPDGWALSTKEPSLYALLTMCEDLGIRPQVRVMPWVKPFCSWKPGVGVAYSWEPVLVYGGRKRTRAQNTVRDWCSANITLQTGTHGAKPEAFCFWLFEVLNLQPGDDLVDLFPGSGAVTRAWARWQRQLFSWQEGA
jgi:hypothetical protein